jgi:peptidoglycan/xylan/chitin deacetylase (PgdA/CDA1 family)
MSLADWAREALYRALYAWTGSGRGVRVILLYHSVGSNAPHSVPLAAFEWQMDLLIERFKVVRLCDLPKMMASGSPETNFACVTFDDGYRDNYGVALPVLERFGIKATFFIATGFLGRTFNTFAGAYAMMDPGQVRELALLDHEIGAHTVNHPKLTKVPQAIAWEEISQSKEFLEDLLQAPICSFAYPKGDYNGLVIEYVRRVGFQSAVTVREGLVDTQPDWLALPRIWVSGKVSPKGFRARLSPATTLYRRWRK